MTFTVTHAASATPTTTSPIVTTFTGVVGRLYVLMASRAVADQYFTTVTDTGGNTWTKQEDTPDSGTTGRRIEAWYCVPSVAFTTVSAAFSGAGQAQATLVEIQGFEPSSIIDSSASNFRAASTTPAVVNVTPTLYADLVISAIQANVNNHSTQVTLPSGWTNLAGYHIDGPKVVYRINPTAGVAVGAAYVLTNSVGSGHVILAIKAVNVTAAVGRIDETGTVNALAKLKSKAIGQIVETGTVNALAKLKYRAATQVTETGTVNAVSKSKFKAVGQVTETGTVNAVSKSKFSSLGQVTETGTVNAVSRFKFKSVGQVSETGTVNAASRFKFVQLTELLETGTVFPVTSVGGKLIGLVTETGTVFPLTTLVSESIGLVTETGSIFPITSSKSSSIGQILETGTVNPVTPGSAVTVTPIGLILEYGIASRIGPPLEINTYVTMSVGQTLVNISIGETAVYM